MNQMYLSTLILAFTGGAMYFVRDIPFKIFNYLKAKFVFTVVVYSYDELFYAIEDYLYSRHSDKYMTVEASYEDKRKGFDNPRTYGPNLKKIFVKQEPTNFIIKHEGRRIVFSKEKKELTQATDIRSLFSFHYSIYGYRAKGVIMSLLQQITDDYNKEMGCDKIGVWRGNHCWDLAFKKKVKSFSEIIINKDLKRDILSDLAEFRKSEGFYSNLNILYKRTYLLEGPPGTGKTSIAQSIAAYLNKDIAVLNLNSLSGDDSLINLYSQVPENNVLIIEDIDSAFTKRDAKTGVKISFAALLNCLDGPLTKSGLVTIITTNHIEQLDPALIRAGRVDKIYTIGNGGIDEVKEYMELFYGKEIYLPNDEISIPMSRVQEFCIANKNNYENAIEDIFNNAYVSLAA